MAYQFGYKAGEILFKWITEKKKPADTKIKINPQLIIRASCGCKKENI
jgi:DNA-binding LacI/PurR family transcriptional regulator